MTEEKVEKKRRNKYLKHVEAIQNNAAYTKLDNGVVKELTYQQGLSVLLRSRQLIKEGAAHPGGVGQEELQRQIDICYRQRARQQRQQ